jgi:hypothetical protein
MNNIKDIFSSVLIFISLLLVNACQHSTNPSDIIVEAPSRNLSSSEIMRIQGIASVHYVNYDSIIVNGKSDTEFHPMNEYYIDTCHCKHIQYYFSNHNWNTTVYNLCDNTAWNYYNNQLAYLQLPNWPAAYEMAIQSALGSWIKEPAKYLHSEFIDGKYCNVYEDSTGYQEWVWIKYKLPIQRRVESHHDVHQIGIVRKRIIEINQPIPSSVYEPPK